MTVGTTNPTNLLTQGAVGDGQTMTIKIGANAMLTLTFDVGDIETLGDLNTALGRPGRRHRLGRRADRRPHDHGVHLGSHRHHHGRRRRDRSQFRHSARSPAFRRTASVVAQDVTSFLNESLGGGAVTVYDISGSAVNVQMRWAKVDSSSLGAGHTDTWNLFYQSNSTATGSERSLDQCRRRLHLWRQRPARSADHQHHVAGCDGGRRCARRHQACRTAPVA